MIGSDAKLVAIYDKLDNRIKLLKLKHGVDGAKGNDGISIKGDQGDRGHDGVGYEGKQGPRGAEGAKGDDGFDGISVTSAEVDFDDHLILKLSDGSEIDAGDLSLGGGSGDQYYRSGSSVNITNGSSANNPKGTSVLDFGSGSKSVSLVVASSGITDAHQVSAELSSEPTAEHSATEILIDPIRVMVYNIVAGTGFTIYGEMPNATANGTYNINWHTR